MSCVVLSSTHTYVTSVGLWITGNARSCMGHKVNVCVSLAGCGSRSSCLPSPSWSSRCVRRTAAAAHGKNNMFWSVRNQTAAAMGTACVCEFSNGCTHRSRPPKSSRLSAPMHVSNFALHAAFGCCISTTCFSSGLGLPAIVPDLVLPSLQQIRAYSSSASPAWRTTVNFYRTIALLHLLGDVDQRRFSLDAWTAQG